MAAAKIIDENVLVADFGGTNVRFAISTPGGITHIARYKCADYPDLERVVRQYLNDMSRDNGNFEIPARAVFAVAGPAHNKENFHFGNIEQWGEINFKIIGEDLKIDIDLINDFAAQAAAPLNLRPEDFEYVVQGSHDVFIPGHHLRSTAKQRQRPGKDKILAPIPDADKRIIILGAGTGLGIAEGHVGRLNKYVIMDGEGGRLPFPATTDREWEIVKNLRAKFDNYVSFERVCSGPGLVNVYNALREIDHTNGPDKTPEEIVRDAIDRSCAVSAETLDLFTRALARVASTQALDRKALGGIIISGGIVPSIRDDFDKATFREEFIRNDLGKADFVRTIPVAIVTEENAGLLGAHAYAQELAP